MIRAVGFDLDNTLFDHTHAAGTGIASLAESRKWKLDPSIDVTQEWNRIERFYFDQYLEGIYTLEEHRRERIRAFLELASVSVSEEKLSELWTEYLIHYSNSWVVYPDVHSTLAQLQGLGIKMAVLTNGQQRQQETKLEKLEVDMYFEFVLAIGRMEKPKPHPEAFLQMAKLFDCSPDEVLYVGDDPEVDYFGAQRAGLNAAWLNRKEIETSHLVEYQISTLSSLQAFIR